MQDNLPNMDRPENQMTDAERMELQTHMSRLESSMSTQEEKDVSRRRVDELRHRGPLGAVARIIEGFEERLSALEARDVPPQLHDENLQKLTEKLTELADEVEAKSTAMVDKLLDEITAKLRPVIAAEAMDAAVLAVSEHLDGPAAAKRNDG